MFVKILNIIFVCTCTFVNPNSAVFDILYTPRPSKGVNPAIEETNNIFLVYFVSKVEGRQ